MSLKPILRLVILFLLPFSCHAQFCETVTDAAFMDHFDALAAAHAGERRAMADTGVVDVPVMFHVQLKGGSPVLTDTRLAEAIAATNRWYAAAKVRFVKCGATQLFQEGTNPVQNRRAVNVAMFRQADGCGYASGSYVFINLNCNRTLENILSHELGHVMGLPHTHGYTNSGTTDELADGSNCGTAGDRFCDTPADPNLLGVVDGSCRYVGSARDASGMEYHPLTDNIMSYSNSACVDSLTPMQFARVRDIALVSSYVCCMIEEPLVADTAVCSGSSVTLHAGTPIGMLAWFDMPVGGTPVGFGPDFQTPPLISARAWYVEAVDSCTGPRARVIVSINPPSGVITDGVRLVQDIDTVGSSSPRNFLVVDDLLVFVAQNGLWVTDGSPTGARLLAAAQGGESQASIVSLVKFGNAVLYGMNDRASGPSLWRADPRSGTVTELMVFSPREGFSNFWLTDAGGYAIFMLNDGSNYAELWRTDGSTAGTQMIAAMPEHGAFGAFSFTPFHDGVVFRGGDSLHGTEIWFTDGTAANTHIILDIWPGSNGSDPEGFTISDGRLYFSAANEEYGRELWVTDGTDELCRRVSDINRGPASSQVGELTALYGSLYFYAVDGATNYEPYVSDGTPEGTRRLAEIRADNGSFPSHFTAFRDEVYCVANDGSGNELWALDPKGAGAPRRVRDINPAASSGIGALTEWNGLLYFSANDGRHGAELWRSDGTEAGTHLVADIDTGSGQGGGPTDLTPFSDGLFFSAFEKTVGRELFALSSNDIVICSGNPALLIAGNTEGVVRWYESEASSVPVGIGTRLTTPPLSRSRDYWADLTVGECTSARGPIAVRVLAPEPEVRDTAVVPGGDVELTASAESGTLEWFADSTSGGVLHAGDRLLLTTLLRDTTVYVANSEESCRSRRVPLHVYVRTSSIDEPPLAGSISVYPHPVGDLLQVRLPEGTQAKGIVIYDMFGREMLRSDSVSGIDGILRLSLSGLPDGQYFAVVAFADVPLSVRFVKLR
ncbi:MAG: ELWxxDGT repeat protein [Bacteroidota bacterium]